MRVEIDSDAELCLRPLCESDLPELQRLMDTIYRSAYQYMWKDQGDWYLHLIYNIQNFQKELSRERSHYFYVDSAGQPIGILKYDYPFSPREVEIPAAMKLHRLYLHSDFHGKGVAQALVKHCEKIAQENGLLSIWLEVMSNQPQARRFYQKTGFEFVHSYSLDFERLLPEYRGIEIWKKDLG